MSKIFDPIKFGAIEASNRIVMAPLTRMRSGQPGNIPHQLNAKYYAQRASAGLIISEATQVSSQAQGYPATPGIHSKEQIEGWKMVTKAVHQAGGKIVLQLWHVGRISHRSHQPDNQLPVAPSAIKPSGGIYSADWKEVAFETPRALENSEISGIVDDFKKGAENAKLAGFDGVEVHGANGYLIDQFLQTSSNQRTDNYGGSIENRCRFLLEVVDAVSQVWGYNRTGVRLSPYGTFNDMKDEDPISLFTYALKELDKKKIAFIDLIEPRSSNAGGAEGSVENAPDVAKTFRGNFSGSLISAGGYSPSSAKEALDLGNADAIAFGRWFISNPDLVERIKIGAELNKYNRATFYGGLEKGYTDYPTLNNKS